MTNLHVERLSRVESWEPARACNDARFVESAILVMGSTADSQDSWSSAQRPLIWLDRAPPVTSARHVVMGFGDTLPTLAFGVSH